MSDTARKVVVITESRASEYHAENGGRYAKCAHVCAWCGRSYYSISGLFTGPFPVVVCSLRCKAGYEGYQPAIDETRAL